MWPNQCLVVGGSAASSMLESLTYAFLSNHISRTMGSTTV
jgi:hypothetical protein